MGFWLRLCFFLKKDVQLFCFVFAWVFCIFLFCQGLFSTYFVSRVCLGFPVFLKVHFQGAPYRVTFCLYLWSYYARPFF